MSKQEMISKTQLEQVLTDYRESLHGLDKLQNDIIKARTTLDDAEKNMAVASAKIQEKRTEIVKAVGEDLAGLLLQPIPTSKGKGKGGKRVRLDREGKNAVIQIIMETVGKYPDGINSKGIEEILTGEIASLPSNWKTSILKELVTQKMLKTKGEKVNMVYLPIKAK